jgi:hypothetical protein
MPYDPNNDNVLKKMQSEMKRLNRELRVHYEEDKLDQALELSARIRERVAKKIRKKGAPLEWET